MKKYIKSIVLASFIFLFMLVNFSNANSKVNLYVDNKNVNRNDSIVIENTVFVPIRVVGQALGAEINWERTKGNASELVTIKKDDKVVKIFVGETFIIINNSVVRIDKPAKIYKGKLVLPLRRVSEIFNASVKWDSKTRSVFITKDNKENNTNLVDIYSFDYALKNSLIKFSNNLTVSYVDDSIDEYFSFLLNFDTRLFEIKSEDYVLDLVNYARIESGANKLAKDDLLKKAVDIRTIEIGEKFSHTRPNGKGPFTAYEEVGGSIYGIGENIAKGYYTPIDVYNGWMTSEGHRRNILKTDYRYLSVGCRVDGAISWVQLFLM